ncbi:MAG: DUF896 domain-containing protein [Negativicutes bacterium]|jgi:uncharacterized protein YnzC (UPF0291/DUF896 family)
MEIKDLIARINELANKKKTVGLADEEIAEQAVLRREYLDGIKAQVKTQLDCVTVVENEPKVH